MNGEAVPHELPVPVSSSISEITLHDLPLKSADYSSQENVQIDDEITFNAPPPNKSSPQRASSSSSDDAGKQDSVPLRFNDDVGETPEYNAIEHSSMTSRRMKTKKLKKKKN